VTHKFYKPAEFHIRMEMENSVNEIVSDKKSKSPRKYERFGEIIRHFTIEELDQLFDSIDNYKHKLMFEVIYELGCRVGEFVKIQVKHINFNRSTVFFPAENTKTKHARISYLPQGLTNEIKSMLKQRGVISKRDNRIKNAEAYLFHPGRRWNRPYTPNRIRQIFQVYVNKAGLQQIYGKDTFGRNLKMFTPHSLRHSHAYINVVDRGVPLPIVQKQIGHVNLKTTSVYLQPSTEQMAEAYNKVRNKKVE
jgi:integrase/recombinase XerD